MSSTLALALYLLQCNKPSKQRSVFFDNEGVKNTSTIFASLDVPPSSVPIEEGVVVINIMGGGKEVLTPLSLHSNMLVISSTAATILRAPKDHG